ncbi:50S ribosomal protein L24 [Candidatus Woesearchaeota archaeon]|jgi:large subunit ribosomal protein L24|nr:50S ribosomal protein L24 [Candidatus Woesearchaeota archaeon]
MKKAFSTNWISSKQPRKQRKYRYNAPLHLKKKFLGVHFSKELKTKHNTRSLPVVKGDKVKVIRGQFKGKENKVERIDVMKGKVFITGIERSKKDGSKSLYPFQPSNLLITELNLRDVKRKEKLEMKSAGSSVKLQSKETQAKKELKQDAKVDTSKDVKIDAKPEVKTIPEKKETTKEEVKSAEKKTKE